MNLSWKSIQNAYLTYRACRQINGLRLSSAVGPVSGCELGYPFHPAAPQWARPREVTVLGGDEFRSGFAITWAIDKGSKSFGVALICYAWNALADPKRLSAYATDAMLDVVLRYPEGTRENEQAKPCWLANMDALATYNFHEAAEVLVSQRGKATPCPEMVDMIEARFTGYSRLFAAQYIDVLPRADALRCIRSDIVTDYHNQMAAARR